MNLRETLKDYLQQPYESIDSFLSNVIFPVFGEEYFETAGNDNLLKRYPDIKAKADDSGILSIINVGRILIEGSELGIYDITVSSQRQLARSRVAIQDVIRKIIGTYSGAFMIFHYKTMEGRWDWRFTFCHKGASNLDSTDAKRYTFMLGPSQSCRTAAENFEKIHNKIEESGEFEMDDIVRAFDVEALSEEFFRKYKVFYAEFVSYMCNEANGMRQDFITTDFDHAGLTPEQIKEKEEKPIRDYIKKLLGRLVFLQFLQKKGWMGVPADKEWGDGDYDFLRQLFLKSSEEQKANFLDGILEPLFTALDTDRPGYTYDTRVDDIGVVKVPYLNGGLFERDRYDEPDTVFPADFFGRLLEFFYEYNFTIDENDPNDAEVGIDAEMLGKIFENLLEDNKDKGAFYTPKEVVQYMCREALTAYLQKGVKSDVAREELRNFVATNDVESLLHVDRKSVDDSLRCVTICDPAIGSGAFPMGLLREIYNCRQSLEPEADLSVLKKEIICNNIYGVDIEKGAIDIARLRFWLSIIVDADEPEALPNFDYKFMQGNSLLESFAGFDLSKLAEFKESQKGDCIVTLFDNEFDLTKKDLQDLTREFFATSDHERKAEIRREIDDIVIQFIKDSTSGNKKVLEALRTIDMNNKPFFLWHLNFQDVFADGGFDIVIGNPPYVEAKKLKHIASTLKPLYDVYSGTADLSIYFQELALNLCKEGGITSFITTNKFFNTGYGKPVRKLITDNTIAQILDFEQCEVFEGILVSTVIINVIKQAQTAGKADFRYQKYYKLNCKQFKDVFTTQKEYGSYSQDFLTDAEWSFADTKAMQIKAHIENGHESIGDIDSIHVYRGITTGYNPAFIIDDQQKDSFISQDPNVANVIKNMLQGRNIRKWYYNESDENLLQTGYDTDIQSKYPLIYNHLNQFNPDLSNRSDQGKNWWNLRSCQYYGEFERVEKIIWGLTADKWAYTLDTEQHYLPSNGYILTSDTIPTRYILGLLNSNLLHYYFHFIGVMTAGGAYTLKAATIEALPLAIGDENYQREIISVVNEILSAKKADKSAQIDHLEQRLNSIVYKIYGISDDEIKIIEGK